MAVTDPYPGQPTDGQALDAVPILAKFNALFQAIQAFDGSQINAGSVSAAAFASSINPNTLLHDTIYPFVQSGLVWSTVSGLNGTMSSGVLYGSNGASIFRVSVAGVGSHTFAANSDTYIDIDYNGNITYSAVANNAASPALTANSQRIAIVITGASITQVNQGNITATAPVVSSAILTVCDSLGNLIYNTNPTPSLIGYRIYTTNQTFSTQTQLPAWTLPVVFPGSTQRTIELAISSRDVFTTGGVMDLKIWRGAVGGTQINGSEPNMSAGAQAGVGRAIDTQTGGTTQTYNVSLSGTANATLEAASTYPAIFTAKLL